MNMRRIYFLFIALFITGSILAGCQTTANIPDEAEKDKTVENADFPVTITDGLDQKVTIEEKPEKIVSLIPSNTEISYALGLEEEIVGVSDFDNYPENVSEKEKIGGIDFNVEKFISFDPNFVLSVGSTSSNKKSSLQQLEDAGSQILIVNDAQSFTEVYDSIEMIGKATGKEEKANKIIEEMKNKLADIEKRAEDVKEKKAVYVELSAEPEIYTAGKGTFIDEMLKIIHAENVAKEEEGWAKISEEAVIAFNPDVIITTYWHEEGASKQVCKRKSWQDIKAINEKQVFDLDEDLVSRSGPRLVEGVEELAKVIYPDVFAQ